MGCASSKQKRCRHCQTPYSPVHRSYSMHGRPKKEESYHIVALTSSTLGSLKLDHYNEEIRQVERELACKENAEIESGSKEFLIEINEAKAWSNTIEEKIPKMVPRTPVTTPPGEPETINTWELMEGLEDVSPFRSPNHVRSFSFDVVRNPSPSHAHGPVDRPKSRFQENGAASPKPMWLQMANSDDDSNPKDFVSDIDQEVLSTFRKSLEELSPSHPFHIRKSVDDCEAMKVSDHIFCLDPKKDQPCRKEKVILYFTSLRGVRKTYEDCCDVRIILKGIGVRIDERDVSMHSGFKDELKELLGDGFYRGGLPRVFVGRNYMGGADEIRRMHDEGRLEKALEDCEMVENGVCEACGDIRFVPCETCSGSCKIYYEEEYCEDGEEEEGDGQERGRGGGEGSEEGEFGFQRCPDCNENGLIRCPICCD